MEKNKKLFYAAFLLALSLFGLVLGLFSVLYHYDNKYTAGPPYGENGSFAFEEKHLVQPLFLIDGWELYPDQTYKPTDFLLETTEGQTTFIGQYSNFSYLSNRHSPFGKATYRLTLDYSGPPRVLSMEIPEIFTEYTLWINDNVAAVRGSGTEVSFWAEPKTVLILNVENFSHYYSGLTYPPMLGTPETLNRMLFFRTLFYSLLCVSSLTLTLFSMMLWFSREHDALLLHFGFLCLFFALHCAHPFVWQAGLSGPLWYALEDTSWLALLAEAVMIASTTVGFHQKKWFRRIVRPVVFGGCFLCFITVAFIIPQYGNIVKPYGALIDFYKVLCWVYLALCAGNALLGRELCRKNVSGFFILSGCCVLGASLFDNFLNNNRFEPIYTGWQTEYAGLLLVLVFGGLMIWRTAELLRQNRMLTTQLEQQVVMRTAELQSVLEERKNFFSDMAHNLKAPITAIHGFISLIRDENIHVDDELRGYISLIESENMEMHQRVQALNTLNSFDRIHTPVEVLEINSLLDEVYENNEPEASAAGIHFTVNKLNHTAFVYAQREKLLISFENLIYNAIAFTPAEGTIVITAQSVDGHLFITVSDTGCGISAENLPHVFERFYTARVNKNEGSGLGLYIAKITIEELGGKIAVASQLGKGTAFTIEIPFSNN